MKQSLAKEFISRVGKIGKRWGIGEPAGKIWGALAYSHKPLTQKEIAQKCSYSLGLVSRNLHLLRKMDIVVLSNQKGKERVYRTVSSFSESFSRLVSKFKAEELNRVLKLLENSMERKKNSARQKMSETLGSLMTN